MQCSHCGNGISPERATIGYNYCTACAVFYTPETVVVPMGIATRPTAIAPLKQVVKSRPKAANGRFQVTTTRDEIILNARGDYVKTIQVADPDETRGFDNLDNAMAYALAKRPDGTVKLVSPRVRDSLPSQQGGMGQLWPTPDRGLGTHHVRWARY